MQLLLDASIHIEQRDICNRTAIYWAAELEKMGGQFTQELQCIRWRVIGMSSSLCGFVYALFEVLIMKLGQMHNSPCAHPVWALLYLHHLFTL